MQTYIKSSFYLFTGGPGAGKSTVLEELARRGYAVVPEVARAIIRHQHATGGNATHTGDRKIYTELMLQYSIEDYLKKLSFTETVFFDRGIPDLFSYTKQFCGGVDSAVKEAINQYRYNTEVFLFPPWPEIYCHDSERKQDFSEAVETWHSVKEGYTASGYQVLDVPKDSVSARADFVENRCTKNR